MEEIWIEKYRPMNLSEVVGQSAVTTRLKNYVNLIQKVIGKHAFNILKTRKISS